MFRFWKFRTDLPPATAGDGDSAHGSRMIDVAGLIRQASTLVSVGELIRHGKKDIHLLSREKIDQLISRALKAVVERYREAGTLGDPSLQSQMEEDSKKEFSDLLTQQQDTQKASDELDHSRAAMEGELRLMQEDLAQQRLLADGRLPRQVEKAMLAKRFDQLAKHLTDMQRALGTLFSAKLYTYRQLQDLLRRSIVARRNAAKKPKIPALPAIAKATVVSVPPAPGKRVASYDTMELALGRGLDLGSVSIRAAAKRWSDGAVLHNVQRNAFIDVRDDEFARRSLNAGIDYIVRGDRGYIIGDAAIDLGHTFEREVRRPVRGGSISPEEPEAIPILEYLIAKLLGRPRKTGEVCVYSLPGDLLESAQSFIYHRGALEAAVAAAGFTPRPMLESQVIVASELQDYDYTGIGVSCGGGTVNVCLVYKGVPAFAFSTGRGGDWIDASAAAALGLPEARVCAVKEGGMDLCHPKGREEEAVAIYTRHFIQHTAQILVKKLKEADHAPAFPSAVPLVCAGGSATAVGFMDLFREEFDRIELPFLISDLRLAADPLRVVASGCLQVAVDEMAALEDPAAEAKDTLRKAI